MVYWLKRKTQTLEIKGPKARRDKKFSIFRKVEIRVNMTRVHLAYKKWAQTQRVGRGGKINNLYVSSKLQVSN